MGVKLCFGSEQLLLVVDAPNSGESSRGFAMGQATELLFLDFRSPLPYDAS
jgi:hypothetical protein